MSARFGSLNRPGKSGARLHTESTRLGINSGANYVRPPYVSAMRAAQHKKEDAELLCACGNKALSKVYAKGKAVGYCRKCQPAKGIA